MSDWMLSLLIMLGKSLLVLAVLLIYVAYILYFDRKVWAAVQLRRGPNVVGPWGLMQSFADMIKFVLKEPVIPQPPLGVQTRAAVRPSNAPASRSPGQSGWSDRNPERRRQSLPC